MSPAFVVLLSACSAASPSVSSKSNKGLDGPPVPAATASEPQAPELIRVDGGHAGTLDPSFGKGGISKLSFSKGEHRFEAIAVQPDGKLLISGYMPFEGSIDFKQQREKGGLEEEAEPGHVVLRLDEHGQLDTSYGQQGGVRIGDRPGFPGPMVLAADGKLYVAGYQSPPRGGPADLVLARILPSGQIDKSFGNQGVVIRDFGGSDDRPSELLLMPGGGVMVVGIHSKPENKLGPGSPPPGRVSRFPNDYESYVARFTEKGEPDKSFGKDGVVFVDVTDTREFTTSALLLEDGRIVLSGYVVRDDDVFLARLLPDGRLDARFGVNGKVVMGDSGMGSLRAMAADKEGNIYVGGQMLNDGPAGVIKCLPDGRRDSAFGVDGVARAEPSRDDQLYFLGLGRDGSVVGAGFHGLADQADFFVARFTPRGKPDPSVQGKGYAITRITDKGDFGVGGAMDSLGRLLLAGEANGEFAVARYRM